MIFGDGVGASLVCEEEWCCWQNSSAMTVNDRSGRTLWMLGKAHLRAYGSHFCGRPETRFNGIGGPKLGAPKTQIETKKWCQFLNPSFNTICLPRDAFQNTLIQRARLKHGRPTWRDRFSNLNQAPFPGPWNHAEVKATSQIAPRVVQKAPLLIRSGKCLICVCESAVLRQCDLIIRMSVIWRWEPFEVNLYFVRSRFILKIGFFAYDTCMFMVIRLPCTYLCIFFWWDSCPRTCQLNGLCIDPTQFYFWCTLSMLWCCYCINSLNLKYATGFPACLTTESHIAFEGKKTPSCNKGLEQGRPQLRLQKSYQFQDQKRTQN